LLEVLAASVIGSLLAGGTLMAFVAAANIAKTASSGVEAGYLAEETLEKFRNQIACDDVWFDPTTPECTVDAAALPTDQDDPLPSGSPLLSRGGERTYTVSPIDLDGDGETDYFEVRVTITWN
jgi:hypothetical protein